MKSFTLDSLPNNAERRLVRADAASVLFFAEELATPNPVELQEVVLPLTLYNLFYEYKEEDHVLVHMYNMFHTAGESAVVDVANGGSQNVTSVTLGGMQEKSPIRHAAINITYTDHELNMQFKRSTIEQKRRQALRSNYQRVNDCLLKGDTKHGLSGILNNKNIPAATQVTSTGWAARTGDLIDADLLASYNESIDNTGGSIKPDTLLMSASIYNLIASKPYSTTGFSNQSVLQAFLAKAPTIRNVVSCTELNNAFSGNANGFVFFNNSSDYVYQVTGHPFKVYDPVIQNGGLAYSVLATTGYGGLIVPQPKMFSLRYGC